MKPIRPAGVVCPGCGTDDLSFVLADEKRFKEALDNAHEALLSAPVAKRSEIGAQIAAITPKANGTSQ